MFKFITAFVVLSFIITIIIAVAHINLVMNGSPEDVARYKAMTCEFAGYGSISDMPAYCLKDYLPRDSSVIVVPKKDK